MRGWLSKRTRRASDLPGRPGRLRGPRRRPRSQDVPGQHERIGVDDHRLVRLAVLDEAQAAALAAGDPRRGTALRPARVSPSTAAPADSSTIGSAGPCSLTTLRPCRSPSSSAATLSSSARIRVVGSPIGLSRPPRPLAGQVIVAAAHRRDVPTLAKEPLPELDRARREQDRSSASPPVPISTASTSIGQQVLPRAADAPHHAQIEHRVVERERRSLPVHRRGDLGKRRHRQATLCSTKRVAPIAPAWPA